MQIRIRDRRPLSGSASSRRPLRTPDRFSLYPASPAPSLSLAARSPLPRTIDFLPALVHEHIVCEVPITDRTWVMEPGLMPLPNGRSEWSNEGSVPLGDLSLYRRRIAAWERDGLNRGDASGLKLHTDLKELLRGELWEGAKGSRTSPLAEAIATQVQRLVAAGHTVYHANRNGARSAEAAVSAASSQIDFLSTSRSTGTTRPAGVSTAMPMWQ